MPARLRPVADAPALLIEADPPRVGRTLVIADVHLGLGATKERPGGPPEGSGPRLAESLLSTVRAEAADHVVIAGDIKHPIVGTLPPLRPVVFEFFRLLLASGLNVEVVLGNHDVGLERHLPREVVVRPASGWRYRRRRRVPRPRLAFRRGPSSSHTGRGTSAPGIPARPRAPTTRPASGAAGCDSSWPPPPPRRGRRPRKHEIRSRELIVLPAFNPLAGTEALNR